MWIIYRIDRKTKIPIKWKEGNDDRNLHYLIEDLAKYTDYIWAVRFNME